jgi:hypothetical protein
MRERLPRRRAEWAGDPTREERALLARWIARS